MNVLPTHPRHAPYAYLLLPAPHAANQTGPCVCDGVVMGYIAARGKILPEALGQEERGEWLVVGWEEAEGTELPRCWGCPGSWQVPGDQELLVCPRTEGAGVQSRANSLPVPSSLPIPSPVCHFCQLSSSVSQHRAHSTHTRTVSGQRACAVCARSSRSGGRIQLEEARRDNVSTCWAVRQEQPVHQLREPCWRGRE